MDLIPYKTPKILEELSRKSFQETKAFVKKLKKKRPKNLDTIVHSLHEEAFSNLTALTVQIAAKQLDQD